MLCCCWRKNSRNNNSLNSPFTIFSPSPPPSPRFSAKNTSEKRIVLTKNARAKKQGFRSKKSTIQKGIKSMSLMTGQEASTSGWRGSAGQECDAGKHKWHLCFRSGWVGGSDAGQVARPGWRLQRRAGGAAGVSTRSDDPPRCPGNLAFVTLVPPLSRKRGTKGPLGEPVLIGRASTHWASHQTRLGEPGLSHSTTFTVASTPASKRWRPPWPAWRCWPRRWFRSWPPWCCSWTASGPCRPGRSLWPPRPPARRRPTGLPCSVVSELCSVAMLLPCAATCPSVVARAAASLGAQLPAPGLDGSRVCA